MRDTRFFKFIFLSLIIVNLASAQLDYLGDFAENSPRDLSYLVNGADASLTIEKCIQSCVNLGYKYAGLQNGTKCFCGNTYGSYGKALVAGKVKCSGNQNQICGDAFVNSVYRTNYVGCFIDKDVRDLPYLAAGADNLLSTQKCIVYCRTAGYKYAAAQFGSQCFCGNTYGAYGNSTACNMACSGNANQFCGNGYVNSIYETNYIGCYADASSPRDLEYLVPDSSNYAQKCIQSCRNLGYKYSGLQNGDWCACGNSYGRHGKSTSCTAKCPGNTYETCGGPFTNSIYETNVYIVPITTTSTTTPTTTTLTTTTTTTTSTTTTTTTTSTTTSSSTTTSTSTIADASSTVSLINKIGSFLNPIGCFEDDWVRDLDGAYASNYFDNSPLECVNLCSSYFFKYSGVQHGHQCWCGDSVSHFGSANNCNIKCIKNKDENCGGAWANSAYLNKIEDTISATVCELTSYNLTCSIGKVINIKYAMYGRISKVKCTNYDFARYTDKCMSKVNETIIKVKAMCESKNYCLIRPNVQLYGNPCEGINKYLEVKYICV